jgi:hypothetical protein
MGRKNQFDIWNVEDKYRGKKIMLIPNYEIKELDAIPDIQESYKYTIIDNFQSFSKIRIRTLDIRNEASASDTLKIKVTLENRKNDEIDFEVNKDYPSYISYHFFKGKELVKENNILKLSNGMLNKEIELRIVVPDKAGKYELSLCVRTGWLPPTINSDNHTIKVNPINISKISL